MKDELTVITELVDTTNMKRVKMRVWWIPQVPMHAFRMPVNSLAEAARLTHTLAMYDLFQYENAIKPDYSNAGGLEMWDVEEEDWMEWEDPETGDDIREWMMSNSEMWMTPEEQDSLEVEEACCGVVEGEDPNG